LASVRFTATSRRDLKEIWSYIAVDNEAAADELLDHSERTLKLLSKSPLLGRARKELHSEIRSFTVGNYVIFYTCRKNGITVVPVLSGYRNLDLLF
jgi:toxin ParE1/3/4